MQLPFTLPLLYHTKAERPSVQPKTLCYNIFRRGVRFHRDETAGVSLPELLGKGVANMKWVELTIKLLHIVAVAGAYATVLEVMLKLIQYLFLH